MDYICERCKRHFNSEDANTRTECIGEFWGTPAYEDYDCCPYCGSDELAEAVACEICGKFHYEEDLNGGVCKSCIEKYKDDPDKLAPFGL